MYPCRSKSDHWWYSSRTSKLLIWRDSCLLGTDWLLSALKWYTAVTLVLWMLPIATTIYLHYDDVIMSAIASPITSLTTVYLIVYSRADQRKHQSSAALAFVRGIQRRPVNSPPKGPVTRKMVPFDDVIMKRINKDTPFPSWVGDIWGTSCKFNI